MAFNPNGIFYTSYNPAELNADSFAATVMRLWPTSAFPLYGMTSQLPKVTAEGTAHGYFTKKYSFPGLTINNVGGYVAADTTLTVTSTEGIVAGMVFQTALRENIRVDAVNSATQVTVTRGYGRVAAGAIADTEYLFIVGNSHSESSTRPTARSVKAEYVPNYTVILRNAWALSNSARASLTSSKDYNNVGENRADGAKLHSLDHEGILLFGQAQAPAGDPLTHSTQGVVDSVYQYAPGNVFTAGATTTYDQLEAYLGAGFDFSTSMGSSNERVAFVDRQAMQVIQGIGRLFGNIQMQASTTTFGMDFTEVRFNRGVVRFIEHGYLNAITANGAGSGLLIMVNLDAMALAYLGGRDVVTREWDGTSPDAGEGAGLDASVGDYLSEFATEFKDPESCVIVNGLTAAA